MLSDLQFFTTIQGNTVPASVCKHRSFKKPPFLLVRAETLAPGYGQRAIETYSAARRARGESAAPPGVAFARTGNPSHRGLPVWPRYDAERRATMILGEVCKAQNAPRDHYGKKKRLIHAT